MGLRCQLVEIGSACFVEVILVCFGTHCFGLLQSLSVMLHRCRGDYTLNITVLRYPLPDCYLLLSN